jgi:hypothetical protein
MTFDIFDIGYEVGDMISYADEHLCGLPGTR